MKLMRLAMCVAVFALVGGIALSEDMDVRALQAKLAAQEARLNDLQAKMYSTGGSSDNVADGITSLRKNAVVTLGGTVNTRYFYRQGKVKMDEGMTQVMANGSRAYLPGGATNGNVSKIADSKHGDLRIADAKLEAKIDVNENFDAYLKLDFHDGYGRRDVSGIAQNYWVRWKNVCNTGFGLLVGRDDLKFGGVQPMGILDSYNKDQGGAYSDVFDDVFAGLGMIDADTNEFGEGMFISGKALPTHAAWNYTRTTQITPYWENCDGSFKAEVSFLQSVDTMNGMTSNAQHVRSDYTKYRSINYGVGSMSGRITWKPIEGLKLVASFLNLRNDGGQSNFYNYSRGSSVNGPMLNAAGAAIESAGNSFAANVGFEYRPCFFSRMNIWASYTHGWNAGWIDDMDSDTANVGVSFDLTDQLTAFVQGDYLRVKNDQGVNFHKATGWASYAGLQYRLPYGVNMEAGWRHDQIDYKNDAGRKWMKTKADTIYAHLGFNF